MTNDLVAPTDLSYLPGAPFTADEVDAAVEALRTALRWHIAPVRTETVTLDVDGLDQILHLPTRLLVSVDEVRDADTASVVAASEYRVSKPLAQVKRDYGYWESGYARIQVDLTHGYESCPRDLLPVIAEVAVSQRLTAVRAPVMDQPVTFGDGVSSQMPSTNPLILGRRHMFDKYALTRAGFA